MTDSSVKPVRTPKTVPIIDDYEISNTVLGLGINGKVVQCYSKATREKYALKVGYTVASQEFQQFHKHSFNSI